MKNYILLLLISIMMMSCNVSPSGERKKKEGYSIINIDSCEYIEVSYLAAVSSNGYYSITHKGNCKFCQLRGKK